MSEPKQSPPPPAEPAVPALEAEDDDWENDSAIGGESLTSSTDSIASSIMKHREENGRTYHAYKAGKYSFPNDERESDRLDLQHHLFSLMQDDRLYTSPIPPDQPLHNVLDVGTGTGIWAIDFADAHPETRVLGVDLSPIQPCFVPPNVNFQIDDLEEPWTFSQKFDFIYSRMMVGSLADYPRFFEQAFENLVPGGWLEMNDICFPVQADDDSLAADAPLRKWSSLIVEGADKAGRPATSPTLYTDLMTKAGFINVSQVIYKWPQNRWPKDKKYKELGLWVVENLAPGLEGLSMGLFTRLLGWTKEETEVFLVSVRKDMRDTKIHSYWNIYVAYGQKPA